MIDERLSFNLNIFRKKVATDQGQTLYVLEDLMRNEIPSQILWKTISR